MAFAQKSSWVTCRRHVGLVENAPNDTILKLGQNFTQAVLDPLMQNMTVPQASIPSKVSWSSSMDTVISKKCGFHLCKTCWKLLLHQQKSFNSMICSPPQISHLQFASVTVQRVRLIEIWLKLFPKTPVRWLKRLRSLLSLRHWRIIVISILPFYHYFSYPDMTEMQGEFHRKQSPTLNLVYCSERNKSCSLESQLIRVQPGYVCILSRSWNGRNLSVTSQ